METNYKVCHVCGSIMEPTTIDNSFYIDTGDKVPVENIPAFVCSNPACDEIVYDSDAVKYIDDEIEKYKKNKKGESYAH